ncbi:MAG: energy-coupling factor ABC transporter ATP-binding protein [Nitrospinae bacterium]|nr:energy-coupling factor ABC transporter ATP-binding protein [Nitrospinota bacterium]
MEVFLLENVKFRFETDLVLDIERVTVSSGEVALLTGANGSGKTTLLRVMAGLLTPEDGIIQYKGAPIIFGKAGLEHRRRVTLLAQEPYLFRGNVLLNVSYGLRARGMSITQANEKAEEAILKTRCEGLIHRDAAKLSGGEKKRVALARALAAGAETLLLDEPISHLDEENSKQIVEIIKELATSGITLVVSTHIPEWASSLSVKNVRLAYGRVV